MRTILALCLSVFLVGVGTSSAQAASQDECAIWLCLPGGFPQGCGGAYSAMIDRVKDFKSPLPSLGACIVSGDTGGMSHDYGRAAYIPSRKRCAEIGYEWVTDFRGARIKRQVCLRREKIPEKFVKDQYCLSVNVGDGIYENRPKGCTRTAMYVKMYDSNGQPLEIDGSNNDGYYYVKPWEN